MKIICAFTILPCRSITIGVYREIRTRHLLKHLRSITQKLQFKAEHRKLAESKASETGTEDICEPEFCWCKPLLFLRDFIKARPSTFVGKPRKVKEAAALVKEESEEFILEYLDEDFEVVQSEMLNVVSPTQGCSRDSDPSDVPPKKRKKF